ncbi:hypothetical protein IPH25_00715 [bacterium]|nr:MAG: hypothetical protein IPG37_02835 [bacterium]QQR61951.1 MAG: hypothetical protein IPH25_00715 [bacterium]QQR62458.1 MAG: hypothetical protein IPH67_03460 [bacterium]
MFIVFLLLSSQLNAGELFSPVAYYQKEWLVPAYVAYQKKQKEEYEQHWTNFLDQPECKELKNQFESKNKAAHNGKLVIDNYLLGLAKSVQEENIEKDISKDALDAMLIDYAPSANLESLKVCFFNIRTKLQSVCSHIVFDQTYTKTFEHPFMAIKTFCFELLCINSFITQQNKENTETEDADEFHFNLFCHALTTANDVDTSMAFLENITSLMLKRLSDYKLNNQKMLLYRKFFKKLPNLFWNRSLRKKHRSASEIANLLKPVNSIFPKLPCSAESLKIEFLDTILKGYQFQLTADYCLFELAFQLFYTIDRPYKQSIDQHRGQPYYLQYRNIFDFFSLNCFKDFCAVGRKRTYKDNFQSLFYKNMFLCLYDPFLISKVCPQFEMR